jgi:hypothetical protein
MRCSGLDRALSTALAPWRVGRAVRDPGKVVLDLATALALGGDCAADIAMVRSQPGLFGEVASDPTVSHLISTLADNVEARWPRSGPPAPPLVSGCGAAGVRSAGGRAAR